MHDKYMYNLTIVKNSFELYIQYNYNCATAKVYYNKQMPYLYLLNMYTKH